MVAGVDDVFRTDVYPVAVIEEPVGNNRSVIADTAELKNRKLYRHKLGSIGPFHIHGDWVGIHINS